MAPQDMSDTVLLVTREGMGTGSVELQLRVLSLYLNLLLENNLRPGAICFYTDGVKLLAEGSQLLDSLQKLEGRGINLIACRTCIDYFGLGEKIKVGIVGGMGDIRAAMAVAAKVITL